MNASRPAICLTHLMDAVLCCVPEGTWRIEIPKIPEEANYSGPPQATLLRMGKDRIWMACGYLMLSANPECAEALQELVTQANAQLAALETG